MECTNTINSLNPYDPPELFYKKLTQLSLHQLQEEAKKFNKYAELSQIVNCYLMLRKQPEMKMEMMFDESGWYVKKCNRINLNFEKCHEDVEILKVIKLEKS